MPHGDSYDVIVENEFKALREFYTAWAAFHAAKDAPGSPQFLKLRLTKAAERLNEADAAVRRAQR